MATAILIPAFDPDRALIRLIAELQALGAERIVVINDGSGAPAADVFDAVRERGAVVLEHAVNLGKGAALKTGMNYVLVQWPDVTGVVTADADGQHLAHDILRIASVLEAHSTRLVLGVRRFDQKVPARSLIGNVLTRYIVRGVIGTAVSDTQTGLRGIPLALVPSLLKIPANGYEFELDMLISARHHCFDLLEEPITTVYEDGNKSSHFHPLRDSMRIYMVLFRFTLLSLMTALIDNVSFFLAFRVTNILPLAQAIGRTVAVVFNYNAARRSVFLSDERHRTVLPKYLALVAVNGCLSYALIRWLTSVTSLSVLQAKLLAEGFLFIANFAIQRDLIFIRRRPEAEGLADRIGRRYTDFVVDHALRNAGAVRQSTSFVDLEACDAQAIALALRDVEPGHFAVVAFIVGPMQPEDVKRATSQQGRVLQERKLWHLLPAQHILVIQKH